MKRATLAIPLLLAACICTQAAIAAVAVDFVNASRATRCAEEDNVYVKILGAGVSAFRIGAEHPPYIASVKIDSIAPDFSHCDMSQDPQFHFVARTVTLYDDAAIRLVGHTFPTNWRPDVVDFIVDGKTERGLHLVQLLKRGTPRDIEILVVYPADGYWRAKPLPPAALEDSAYGSSFLFGPIEESSRPFVAIREIVFDAATLTFRLAFRNGGRATLTVNDATRARLSLALTLDPPAGAEQPFAALRSMFVTPLQADTAIAAWPGGVAAPILGFNRINTPVARFGRIEQSQHNLSAPDMVFEDFVSASSH